MSSSEKLMSFMHFHNSCTRNCDYHILLIVTVATGFNSALLAFILRPKVTVVWEELRFYVVSANHLLTLIVISANFDFMLFRPIIC